MSPISSFQHTKTTATTNPKIKEITDATNELSEELNAFIRKECNDKEKILNFSQSENVCYLLDNLEGSDKHVFNYDELEELLANFETIPSHIQTTFYTNSDLERFLLGIKEAKEIISQNATRIFLKQPSLSNAILSIYDIHSKSSEKKSEKIMDEIDDLYEKLKDYTRLSTIVSQENKERIKELDFSKSEEACALIDLLHEQGHIPEKKYTYKKSEIEGLKHTLQTQCENIPRIASNKSLKLQHSLTLILEITRIVSKIIELEDKFIRYTNQRSGNG